QVVEPRVDVRFIPNNGHWLAQTRQPHAKLPSPHGGTMADNLRKRGSPDSKTINMKEAWEKNYWKRKFRVSGQALAGAVRAVGKSAKKVEAYLKNK
ncbi:MAG: DUF3606 domain-containing protein, partial [Pseudolabrys sp.]